MNPEQDDPNVDQDGDVITDINQLPPETLAKLWQMLSNSSSVSPSAEFSNPLDAFAAGLGADVSSNKNYDCGEKDEENINGPFANKGEPQANQGRNSATIACPFCCKSTIFLPSVATLVEKEIFLMYPTATNETQGEIYNQHWQVQSKMSFENIGVRRGVEGKGFRYLTCSDCDKGPLGLTFDEDNNKVFYITDKRIAYRK